MTNRMRPTRSDEYAWKALATIRLVNGGLALLAPRWLARRLGVRPELQPAIIYPLRMFGIRTIFLGVDLLWGEGVVRDAAVKRAVVIHATDTVAAVLAGRIRTFMPDFRGG